MMMIRFLLFVLSLALLVCQSVDAGMASAGDTRALGRQILATTGVKGGLVLHVGCGTGELTAALRAGESYLVHGLDRDPASISRARVFVREAKLLGPVSFDEWTTSPRLPYIDNLARLIVVSNGTVVPRAELLRVLAPEGVAYVGRGERWERIVKPRSANIDEWTHYLHGPDNNAVAHDIVVGPPRHMQWLSAPRWTRNHHILNSISSVVTAGGKLFYIFDEATSADLSVPGEWSIFARDAFSGVLLWKRPLNLWVSHLIGFRSGPPQVTRLLVASNHRVYAPLGLDAPVTEIDAGTGTMLRTFTDTSGAEEIVLVDGTLLVLKGTPVAEQAVGQSQFKGLFRSPNHKSVVAIDVASGRTMWQRSHEGADTMPETLGSDGRRVYAQIGKGVIALDLKMGRSLWTFGDVGASKRKLSYGTCTLVVSDGVVLCNLGSELVAIAADDGKKLWGCPSGAGFHSPRDVLVIDGLVWLSNHPRGSVAPPPVNDFNKARDLHTGAVKKVNQIMVDLQTAGHHHRCYREKATDRYIIAGYRGVEMMDLTGNEHSRNNWVRGTCQHGIMPANGFLYAPTHACGCYVESMLKGFWALAAERPVITEAKRAISDDVRIEKGPAFGKAAEAAVGEESWPQYRHDALRSGVAGTVVPKTLTQKWKLEVGGRLTQPVIIGRTGLVVSTDEGVLQAFDAGTGRMRWNYVAGGRIDSPPAVHEGFVLFGSADGRVYCLRLTDGELVWRFLAAPADLKTVAMDQVESLWPVHGSVLLLNGLAYCSAGRSSWIDGGIDFYGLDPATGKVLHKVHFESRYPRLNEGKDQAKEEYQTKSGPNLTDYRTFLAPDRSDSFSMAGGVVSDVLVSDGTSVFMRQVKFDADLKTRTDMSRHLFSTSSLLDSAGHHQRAHWVLGTGDFRRTPIPVCWFANSPGSFKKWRLSRPYGVMLVYEENAAWGIRLTSTPGKKRYERHCSLFKEKNTPFSQSEPQRADWEELAARSGDEEETGQQNTWQNTLPIYATAMLKSGNSLIIGGGPRIISQDDPHAAYDGRLGGTIWIVSADNGEKIAEYEIETLPVWDGMAAADGRLYISTKNGKVICFAKE